MPGKVHNPFSFLSGFVQSREVGRVIAQIDELTEKGSSYSQLMKWTSKDNRWVKFGLEWTATHMWVLTAPELQVLATGPQGKVSIGTVSGNSEEFVDDSSEGPRSGGPIRNLRYIGHHLYVCGMSRQVYRREVAGRWMRRDAGVVLPAGSTSVAGFNSIDGISEDDIYAVGFGGEIWRYINERWAPISSPTNVVLHQVRVVAPDLVYACGQGGVLLKGSMDRWSEIRHGATHEDLWGVEWFNGQLFVATENRLYRLNEGDRLEEIDPHLGESWSYRHLHANDGVMWSFGPKHLAWTDGTSWFDVTP